MRSAPSSGPLLSRFACFEMLRHKFGKPWWEWPDRVAAAGRRQMCRPARRGGDADEVAFVEFVQWTADRQLGGAADLARRLGMKVGLYLDVAVGVQSDGFDAWNEQVAISRHLGVGAPPDPLNTAGQSWGLAGFNAAGLELQSFAPYRDMLRASMRHAGAIRLDHVLGLKRLYLVPNGFSAADGVYVQMPFEALLAVTAQESTAHRCVVIGEDLGTVPEGFREQMADWGIWSYLVMMFERDDRGAFRGMDHYSANALVTFNTHDLSTYAGWRSFGDLKTEARARHRSRRERRCALACAGDAGRRAAAERHRPQRSVFGGWVFWRGRKSRLLAISLEDLLGVVDQPNIPGTVNEHPNWRRRLPVPIEAMTSAVDVTALRTALRDRSRGASVNRARPYRGLRTDRRLRDRRAGRPRWLDRLAVLAGLRFRRLLCGAARHAQARPLADCAGRGDQAQLAPLLGRHADPGDAVRDRRRRGRPDRLHAAARQRFRRGAAGARRARPGPHADATGDPLRLRRQHSLGQEERRRHRAARHLRARHDGAADAGRDPRRGHDDGRRFRGGRGRDDSLRADLRPFASAGARSRSTPNTHCATPRSSGPNGAATAPIRASIAIS